MMYQSILKTKPILLLIGLLYINVLFAWAQPIEKGIFESLGYKQVVNIELTFDLETLQADRRSNTEYPAQLSFKDEHKQLQEWDIKIKGRGKFRRAMCNEMPPLKINFRKKDLEAAGLAPFDDFKLVTYCVDDYPAAREFLLKEYLVYKMYNELTDLSFRVQLLNITYRDAKTGARKKQMGFLIEDTAQLRARIGAEKSEAERVIEPERFHPQYRKTAAVFEYLIGNTDWQITSSKNVKYIVKDGRLIPVPYDFDFAAVVNASYANFVATNYGQTSRFERIYLGFERSETELATTIAYFNDRKEALYQTIREFRLLSTSEKAEMIQYLDSFFDEPQRLKFPLEDTAVSDTRAER